MIAMVGYYARGRCTVGTLLMREPLPDRRRSWTQHVHIGGQSVYLTVGEYADGRPGEIFVDMSRQGTLLRGVMGTLARMVSISLQCGAGVEAIVQVLRGLDYPPAGPVTGSAAVEECLSVTDWIASELEARYLRPAEPCAAYWEGTTLTPETEEISFESVADSAKAAGYVAESWRSGI
jgi:hypothetical protein